jgi:PAS domain S-box-containing protein
MATQLIDGSGSSVRGEREDESACYFAVHSPTQQRWHWFILAVLLLALAAVCPGAVRSNYRGGPDLHSAVEALGAACGLLVGIALVVHFYSLGNRLYLFIGLGYFVNGAEDLLNGLLSFRNPLGLSVVALERAIPATYVTGRLMLGLLLCAAACTPQPQMVTVNSKRDTALVSLIVLAATMLLTVSIFFAPLPALIFPHWWISRPVDLLSAGVFAVALGVFLVHYFHTREMLLWWLAVSVGVNMVGQVMMAFSRSLYDLPFDLAHVYKLAGYLVPILGLSLYQIAVIRQRQQAEAALRASESRLRQIIDLVPHFIFAKDEEGRFFLANRAMAEAFGTTVEKLIGATDADFSPSSEEVLHFRENDQEVIRSGRPKFIPQESLIDAHGNLRFLQTTKIPFTAAGSDTRAVLGMAMDITSLKHAEDALREAHAELEKNVQQRTMELAQAIEELKQERYLLHTLMDNLPHNIYFKDLASRFIRINRAMANFFGLADPAQAVGKTDMDFFTTEHALQALEDEQQILRSGKPVIDKEEKETWGDGRATWASTTKMPLCDDEGRIVGTFGLSRDITERKQAEAALQAAKEAAESANRAKSAFLANMSHEIRTPMNAILGMTELVLDTPLSSQQREFLLTVQDSAESLLAVINDILDFSKIEAGKLTLDCRLFDLRESLGDTMKSLAVRAHAKRLELAYHIHPEVPTLVHGDANRMRQVVVNLVGNAVKFTDHGEVLLDVNCESQSDEEVLLHFAVSDTGIGIPSHKLDAIFGAFEQADNSTTRRYGGTGLGLAISARLTNLMGGRIWVESEMGQGSTFHFTARFRRAEEDVELQADVEPPLLQGLRVLVVDDSQTNRRILVEMLRNWGLVPVAVAAAPEALEALQHMREAGQPFTLVLTDADMPEIDGFALAEAIKRDAQLGSTVIMMLSSADRPGEPAECERRGIVCHLLKPVKQSELLEAIRLALGTHAAEEAEAAAHIAPAQAVRPLRILVAEDSLVNQKLAINLLQRQGHAVVIANNGREAVAKWESQRYDLILMDVQMPEMDGLEATARIREKEQASSRHIPIIAMTAHAMAGDRQRCLESGMDDYVSKPIRAKELFAKIGELCRGPAAAAEAPAPRSTLPMSGPINWNEALDAVKGDRTLLKIVADAAHDEIPKLLRVIRQALAAGDAAALHRAAHTLKGSIRYFGAQLAFDCAFRLEQMGQHGRLDEAPAMLQCLEREAALIVAGLTELPAEDNPPGRSPES